MTGNIYFAEERKEGATWPPRFWKAILTMEKEGAEKVTLAFDDSRRLGRIRIVTGDPLSQPPISKLGFDPLFNHPDKDTFMALVQKRNMPIKALLLDQSFSAGVGNWVADEILYHSRLHPGQYANTLSSDQCDTLRVEIERVCRIAVEAEADSSKFPEDWLMAYRWKKGKGKGGGKLPNGHKLDFITVGGRTSAYVPALQKLTGDTSQKKKKKRRSAADDEKDGSKEKGAVAFSAYYLGHLKRRARLNKVPAKEERVLLIGCSSGIGRALAIAYAARGAHLTLFARRASLLETLKQECEANGAASVLVVPGDVTDTDAMQRLAVQTQQEGLDTVVYCAGLISVRPFMESGATNDAIEQITRVNYTSAVVSARLFVPILLHSSRAPNFMVVSSMAGKAGAPTRALYAGSKHALHGFFDSLRVEIKGLHVGLVCPATVDTDLRQTAVDLNNDPSNITGSTKGKLSPWAVAQRIIEASDKQEREVYIPAWFGYLALWAKLLASSWVDWAAARKYSQ
ncbi:hypothetical protein BCR43DRAFT_531246 [Syncephalastrum racemosum]|uniref:Uncharacterized protein n=1 Tax=Syncephalastrum racemosum TaxID=13706 RepID=A0A1X2HD89_SYNRA|nr:hypothetical protein BCR43DRAFT_531246 [Syncephalastrum racemosum]